MVFWNFYHVDCLTPASAVSQLIISEGVERDVKCKDVLSKVIPVERL